MTRKNSKTCIHRHSYAYVSSLMPTISPVRKSTRISDQINQIKIVQNSQSSHQSTTQVLLECFWDVKFAYLSYTVLVTNRRKSESRLNVNATEMLQRFGMIRTPPTAKFLIVDGRVKALMFVEPGGETQRIASG